MTEAFLFPIEIILVGHFGWTVSLCAGWWVGDVCTGKKRLCEMEERACLGVNTGRLWSWPSK